jgi:hypothetical protein
MPEFRQPTAIEKFFNRALGALIGLGLGPSHIYLLEVRGRKSGKLYTTPVDPLELKGKRYLVAPARAHAMGSQCGSRWRNRIAKRREPAEAAIARNLRLRETAHLEGLSR